MIGIKTVLVAADFSEPSAAALRYGRELARQFGARLEVLHVADNVYICIVPDSLVPVAVARA